MLSIKDIINILEPKQLINENEEQQKQQEEPKVEKEYNYIDINDKKELKLYISNNENEINNTFINFFSSILSVIDENFILTELKYKMEKIKAFIYKMLNDYDVNNFYYKYYYNKNKKIKKTLIKVFLHEILNNKKIKDIIILQQFISDYFSLNIFILSNNESDIKLSDGLYLNKYFNSNEYDNKINKYCPTIILYQNENNYYPIIQNNNSLYSYKKHYILLKHMYNKCKIFIEKYKYIKKTLVELREISIDKKLNINKTSESTGKIVYLRKNEIIDLLRDSYEF